MRCTKHGRRTPRPVLRRLPVLGALAVALATAAPSALAADAPVRLASAGPFALLAGSAISNTGPTTINGDLGLFPGTAVTGFTTPGATVNGTQHVNDAVAMNAKADLALAYDDAAGRSPSAILPADLGGLLLPPGVYRAPSALGLTGKVTLDAGGDPEAVFVFQVGSELTTASASAVELINGAQACNVFWQVGTSATFGTSSTFVGSLLAQTSASLGDAVTVQGRVLARDGAVTLINDTVGVAACAAPPAANPGGTAPAGGATGPGTTPVPVTPATSAATARRATRLARRAGTAGRTTVVLTGSAIRRVVFTRGGRTIADRRTGPFTVSVPAGGARVVTARVTFSDGRPPAIRRIRLPVPRTPSRAPRAPGGFTG